MKELRIPFKGWDLVAFLNEKDGSEMVAVKPIAMAIGVDFHRQTSKIKKDPRFSWRHMSATGSDGKQYEMLCLPVRQMDGWLYSINANKVKEDVRSKLIAFQEECHIAIYNHMNGNANMEVVNLLKDMVYSLKCVVEQLQAENIELKARLDTHDKLAGIEASTAGKRLVATRHLKLVGSN